MTEHVTAVDLAKQAGVDPRRFRKALRASDIQHAHNERWRFPVGSLQDRQMRAVLATLAPGGRRTQPAKRQ